MEFKEDAVRRANEDPRNIPKLARDLEINGTMLRRWMKEKESGHWDRTHYRKKSGTAVSTPLPPQSNYDKSPKVSGDVEELRRKLAEVTEERDLLKKTLTYYLTKG